MDRFKGRALAILIVLLLWIVALIIVFGPKKLCAQGRYILPDTTKSVTVRWSPGSRDPQKISRWYVLELWRLGGAYPIMRYEITSPDTLRRFFRTELSDSVDARVDAFNFAGHSGYTDFARAVFKKGTIITPPHSTSFDVPAFWIFNSELDLTGFTRGKTVASQPSYMVSVTNRTFANGQGLYITNGFIKRILSIPKGSIMVSVRCCGQVRGDSLVVSLGTMSQVIHPRISAQRDTTTADYSVTFENSIDGSREFRLSASNAVLKSLGVVAASAVDLYAPPKPNLFWKADTD